MTVDGFQNVISFLFFILWYFLNNFGHFYVLHDMCFKKKKI